jgi:hypothetical protein
MKTIAITITSLALAVSALAFEQLPNLVVNGDFEDIAGATGVAPHYTTIPDWTNESKFIGDSTTVELRNNVWAVPVGNYSPTLNGSDADNLQQSIATDVDRVYTLAFQWKPRRFNNPALLPTQNINVLVDGVLVYTDTQPTPLNTDPVPAWINVSFEVVAADVSTAIEFNALPNGLTVGAVIDNVRFTTPPTAEEGILGLIAAVEDLNLANGIDNSLDAKLTNAFASLADLNENNDPQAAIGKLQAFIFAVQSQSGNHIDADDADDLIEAAQAIIDQLLAG